MARLYGQHYSKSELLERVGSISQVGGVRRYTLSDGKQRGVEVAHFRTGTGFSFEVLLGRGMDISLGEYRGIPLSWMSPTGPTAPKYFEPEDLGWFRSFHGGLLTTCGLTYLGAPSVDQGKSLGLHGRVSNIPAKNIYVDGEWDSDEYVMWAEGKIHEAAVFGENILLKRRVWTMLGEDRLFIRDIVENAAFEPVEHMYLYHVNVGFPIVSKATELLIPSASVTPRDHESRRGLEECTIFSEPIGGYNEKVYYHNMNTDDDGCVYAALVNRTLGEGFGIYLKYKRDELPRFVEWKMMGQGTYVVGLEPSNCFVEGRAKERERGTLMYLAPGERREYNLEIGLLSTRRAIENIEAKILMSR